jgi:hypothetical protein
MSAKKTKAYIVREDHDGGGVVVFATNGATARRQGANELNMEFDEVSSCTRSPEFDQYAPGPVPLHATLARGWWHTCSGCGCTFENEGRRDQDEDDREDEFDPVTNARGHNYCSPTCMMTYWAERRDQTARQVAAIEVTSTKWPDATNIITYNSGRQHDQVRTVFRLPGVPDPIDWAPGDQVALVAQRSADDFRRLYGKQ